MSGTAMDSFNWDFNDPFSTLNMMQDPDRWSDTVFNHDAMHQQPFGQAQHAGFPILSIHTQCQAMPAPFGLQGSLPPKPNNPFSSLPNIHDPFVFPPNTNNSFSFSSTTNNNPSFSLPPNSTGFTEPGAFFDPLYDPSYLKNNAAHAPNMNGHSQDFNEVLDGDFFGLNGLFDESLTAMQSPPSILDVNGDMSNVFGPGPDPEEVGSCFPVGDMTRCDSVMDGQFQPLSNNAGHGQDIAFVGGGAGNIAPSKEVPPPSNLLLCSAGSCQASVPESLSTGPLVHPRPIHRNLAFEASISNSFGLDVGLSQDFDWDGLFSNENQQARLAPEQIYGNDGQHTQRLGEAALYTQHDHDQSARTFTGSDGTIQRNPTQPSLKRPWNSPLDGVHRKKSRTGASFTAYYTGDTTPSESTVSFFSLSHPSSRAASPGHLVRLKLSHSFMSPPCTLTDADGARYVYASVITRRSVQHGDAEILEYLCCFESGTKSVTEWVKAIDLEWDLQHELDRIDPASDLNRERVLYQALTDSNADDGSKQSQFTELPNDETDSTTSTHSGHPNASNSQAMRSSDAQTDNAIAIQSRQDGDGDEGSQISDSQQNPIGTPSSEELFSIKGLFTNYEKAAIDSCGKKFQSEHGISSRDFNDLIQNPQQKQQRGTNLVSGFYAHLYAAIPHRKPVSIQKHCKRRFDNAPKRGGEWTAEEITQLLTLHEELKKEVANSDNGLKFSWIPIAEALNRRISDVREYHRDYARYGEKLRRCPWEPDEETQLEAVVTGEIWAKREEKIKEGIPAHIVDDAKIESKIKWEVIADRLGGTRNRLQCRSHWKVLKKRPVKMAAMERRKIERKKRAPRKASKKGKEPAV